MSRKPRERLVSVIVPAHNSAAFLDECIESVLAQTYGNWELIIIDDRSSDATAEIAARHARADSRVRVEHVDFGDVSSARNHGIRVARGELFCFLDSDDAYSQTALEAMAGAIDTPGCDMAVGQFRYDSRNTLRPAPNPTWKCLSGRQAAIATLFQNGGWHCSPWGRMISRKVIESTPLFREGSRYEDLEIAPRHCLASQKVAVTSTPLYFYRRHDGSFINTWNAHRPDVLAITDFILANAIKDGDPMLIRAARSRRFSAYSNILLLALKHRDQELAERCWRIVRRERAQMLRDPHVRLKNKLGAMMFLFGMPGARLMSIWAGK